MYEADAFVPLARLVWLEDKLTQAANDETVPKFDIEKLDQLKQIALQNIGELEGLDETQTIPPVANDESPKHSQHQMYWYQNDHLGTPRELTSNSGDIAWEAVYQEWGMSEDKKNNVFPECKTKAMPEWLQLSGKKLQKVKNSIQSNSMSLSRVIYCNHIVSNVRFTTTRQVYITTVLGTMTLMLDVLLVMILSKYKVYFV